MNVLPLIFFFLILFGCISHGLVSDSKIFQHVVRAKIGYMQVQREARNRVQLAYYKSFPKIPSSKKADSKKNPSKAKTEGTTMSPRSLAGLPHPINLYPLFQKETYSLSFYKACLSILKTCYQSLEGASSEDLDNIFNHLVKMAQKKSLEQKKTGAPFDLNFRMFSFDDDAHLSSIYYKMLRGTHLCDLATSNGFPSLHLIFTIDPQTKREPLCFSKLSQLMLSSIFGPASEEKILKKEIAKKASSPKALPYLKKEELETILQSEFSLNEIAEFIKWIDFKPQPKHSVKSLVTMDKQTFTTDERLTRH